ncbi:MAG: hypothetical protein COB83_09695 [Gammaproteobacteria bacterium]|nr:MAG: hypothetical protein COB83_09695 [Gammaproteobacteria bacterium]
MSITTKLLTITLFTGIISATLILSTPLAIAADGDRAGQQGEDREQQRARRGYREGDRGARAFARLDVNQDGELSLSELTDAGLAKAEKRFNRKDTNEDGVLSLEEFTANARGGHVDLSAIADDIVECVADLKEETGNANIIVPNADVFTSKEDKFNAMDTSGDGVVDLTEFLAAKASTISNAFTMMDTDESMTVSLEEFIAFKKSHYATRRAIHQCINELTDDA